MKSLRQKIQLWTCALLWGLYSQLIRRNCPPIPIALPAVSGESLIDILCNLDLTFETVIIVPIPIHRPAIWGHTQYLIRQDREVRGMNISLSRHRNEN